MNITVILAPYDSGHYRSGFGSGPDAILAAGLVEALTAEGHDIAVEDIGKVGDAQEREIATTFAVCRAVAAKVKAARDNARFPIVLAGNCFTANGSIAGEAADSIVWFDQHGDINTPETSEFGFLDGMSLATVLGLCWQPMAALISGFQAIAPKNCILVDARDLDASEKDLLARLPVMHTPCSEVTENAKRLAVSGVTRTHLHLDLDVHDPLSLTVNRYATPGGPDVELVRKSVCNLASILPISGMTISAYDPAFDTNRNVPAVVKELLIKLLPALLKAIVADQGALD